MKFQVLRNGKVMFWTKHKDCVPDEETIKALKSAGYKIKMEEDKKNESNFISWNGNRR